MRNLELCESGRGTRIFDQWQNVQLFFLSFEDNPEDALDYITPLLTFAEQHIPRAKWKETPLYILATAGMRLVEKTKRVKFGLRRYFIISY